MKAAGPLTLAMTAWMMSAANAHGQEPEILQACVSAYERAGEQRKIFKDPLRSKAEAEKCVSTCPAKLSADCQTWIKEEDAKIARVAITVRNAGIAAATIEIDGQVQTGRTIELNAGAHDLVVSAPGRVTHRAKLQLAEGAHEKLDVDLKPVPDPPVVTETTTPSDTVIGGIVMLGVGLAGLSAAGIVVTLGHLQASDLRSTCAPSCDRADVDRIEREWIASAVTGGVGLGVAVTGLVLIVLPETPLPVRPAAFSAPGATGLAVELQF